MAVFDPRSSGAQTERRGDAGPVGGLLGGKDPAGRLLRSDAQLSFRIVPMLRLLLDSELLLSLRKDIDRQAAGDGAVKRVLHRDRLLAFLLQQ